MELLRDLFDGLKTTLAEQNALRAVLLAVLATLVLVVLLRLKKALFNRLSQRAETWAGTRIRALRFQRQELLSAEEIAQMMNRLLKGFRWFLSATLIALYLVTVFALFPWTRTTADTIFESFVDAVITVGTAAVDYLPELALIIVIAFFTRYLIKLAELVFKGIASGRIRISGFYRDWAIPTFQIIRVLAVVFALVMIYPLLPGSHSGVFRGVSLFIGVLVSLGSTGAVANVVAGVVITYMRAFQIGDRVRISNTEGDVIERSLFVTRILSPKNVEVAVPNAMVLADHIINYSSQARGRGLVLHTSITIGYDVPWKKVHELLIAAAGDTEHVEAEPEPFVIQRSLDDFSVHYELNAVTHKPNRMPAIYSEMHRHILDRFHAAGVEIASPHFAAVRDGNRAAIPEDNLPRKYEPPTFRIEALGINPKSRKEPSEDS